jgi:hypothetical protein
MNIFNRTRTFAQVQQRISIIHLLAEANPTKLAILVYSTIDDIDALIRGHFLETVLIILTSFEMLGILHDRLPQIYIIIDIYFRKSTDILLEFLQLMKAATYFLHLKLNASQPQPRPLLHLHTLIDPQTPPKLIPGSIESPQADLASQGSLLTCKFILAISESAALRVLDGVVIAGPEEGGEGELLRVRCARFGAVEVEEGSRWRMDRYC